MTSEQSEAPLEVVGAIFTHDSRVLAFRRAAYKSAGGKWEFPGGKVNQGESHEVALEREVREELGIDVQVRELIHSGKTIVGDVTIRLSCYLVLGSPEQIVLGDDHIEMQWIELSRYSELDWAQPDIPVVKYLLEQQASMRGK